MNVVAQAFQKAGVSLPPLNKRAWLWLKDHPGKSSKEVAAALGESHSSVATVLGNMDLRKMLIVESRVLRGRNAPVKHYTVKYRDFELLHMPKKHKLLVLAQHPTTGERAPTPTPPPPAPVTPVPRPEKHPALRVLEDCTLKELRVIHDALGKLFASI